MKNFLIMLIVALLPCESARAQTNSVAPPDAKAQASPEQSAHLTEAKQLNEQVIKLFKAKQYDEALPLARRVLELMAGALGPDHARVGDALINIAAIDFELNKLDEAGASYRRALGIVEQNGAVEGEQAAGILYQLALINFRKGDYKQTDTYLKRVLSIKEKKFGPDDPAIVMTLLNIGQLYLSRDGFGKAKPYYARAVDIILSHPPRKNPYAVVILKQLRCPLGGEDDSEFAKRFYDALVRLENPEEVKQYGNALKEGVESADNERVAEGQMRLVEGAVLNGKAVSKPQPAYPIEAKQNRVSGVVVVEILVDEKGKVIRAEAICGHPTLAKACERAALQARFTPTLLAGQPVKVTGTISYRFVLQ